MTKDQYDVLGIYGAFILALISNFIPSAMIQMIGGLLFLVTLIAAYIIRKRNINSSFKHNHMDFLIRSFWIGSLILLLGIIACVFLADNTVINNAVDGMINGISFSQAELNIILRNYTLDNILVFALCIGPSLIYLFYRTIKGIIQTCKYHKIENLKSWF